ncbi:hypothetical protein M6B38_181150 [Iris pallida]|uniref:Uncharacterized protein n=1 Tax=Iris pallida TaxID=29817 RepID=A0AAX6ENB1_IRIPA|nr:hypothetical protein M6B38_181150 [Iris pallida]
MDTVTPTQVLFLACPGVFWSVLIVSDTCLTQQRTVAAPLFVVLVFLVYCRPGPVGYKIWALIKFSFSRLEILN